MLNEDEQRYFDNVLNDIRAIFPNVQIPIVVLDHDRYKGKDKQALGLAYSYDKSNVYKISIDEFFVIECYNDWLWCQHKGGYPKLEKQSLKEVICHELAHTVYWRHGKKHRELTNKLLSKVS